MARQDRQELFEIGLYRLVQNQKEVEYAVSGRRGHIASDHVYTPHTLLLQPLRLKQER
jgi:hypothetical protein